MTQMVEMCCGECGIEFMVPEHFYRERRETKKGWYCPNGHSRVFRESDADKLRRERDRLQQQIAYKDDEIARQRNYRESAERSASAYKGQVTKLKRRAQAGMCPCCNRSFVNLARHMATKHPEFDPAEPLTVVEGGKARDAALRAGAS